MAAKLKVGSVGIGNVFNAVHGPTWVAHPQTEVVAVCDIVPAKAKKFAKANGVRHVFTDYRDLLKLKGLDIVDICTPNLFHSQIAIAALNAGKHVFCEKPDAVSPDEAEKMADAARQNKRLLMVMRNNRFNPASQFVKKYIDAGHMGDIYTGRCGWIRRRGIPGAGGWFTTKALSGGGPLIDLGVHMIDLAVWLMGSPRPVAVTGVTYCKFAKATISDSVHSQFGEAKVGGTFDVEDLASGMIRFDNGASLQIEFSWASNIESEMGFVELRGTKAGCSMTQDSVKVFTEIEGVLCDLLPRLAKPKVNPHAANIHHFIDCLAGRAQPIFKPQEGVDMIKILSAIYASAASGREVKLALRPPPR